MSSVPQLFCRQPKSVELIQAQPIFKPLPGFKQPDNIETRNAQYSPNGNLFIYTQPDGLKICNPLTGELIYTVDIPDVFEIHFSPNGNFITTWSRPSKLNDDSGNWKDNVNIVRLDIENKSFKIIQSYLNKTQSGWIPQYTSDESMICKLTGPSVLDFFKTNNESGIKKPVISLNLKDTGKIQSFQVSPGKNPSVAVFIPGQKGNPAFIRIYSLPNLKTPTSQKQFFKGETCQFKWNDLGTSILALVSTDVDSSNKSYYGETQLYLFGISGSFDQKIDLEKEGPIHAVTWSPTSREFAVIYGYMPAQTTFFDARGNPIHSLAQSPSNTILYSPHAKYILVAGFGNLQGDVDILDRQNKFNKVASFKASNTSVCKWSPDGRFILTATTSPRLRVDNCVKIWYFNGTLCYIKNFNELYGVDWRHQPLTDFPPISVSKPDKVECTPDISAIEYLAKKTSLNKSSASGGGAYRPPNARRSNQSVGARSLAQIEAEKTSPSISSPIPGAGVGGRRIPGSAPTKKLIPGATVVGADSKAASKNKKKRQNKKKDGDDFTEENGNNNNNNSSNSAGLSSDSLIVGGVFSLEEKKIRNLLKKLRAIENLKIKQNKNEFLEETQILKIKTEQQVRKELESLGWKEGQE